MSVTMAVGAKELAKKQVIVKRLTAVEELSSVTILCTDKTGTLTLNELTFDEPYVTNNYTRDDVLLYAYLASEPSAAQDPIELAVRTAAQEQHPQVDHDYVHGYRVLSFTPFNPVDKMSYATIEELGTGKSFRVAKGAPQVILGLGKGDSSEAEAAVEDLASRGLRALGVARTRDTQDDWELVGLISLIDPPRSDSATTISDCQLHGLSVKMITGDQASIAKEVAARLGMGTLILDADHIANPGKSEEEVTDDCLRADGFARVIPEHKYKVVDLLQKRGHFVAMTGDGVNDAAALKKVNGIDKTTMTCYINIMVRPMLVLLFMVARMQHVQQQILYYFLLVFHPSWKASRRHVSFSNDYDPTPCIELLPPSISLSSFSSSPLQKIGKCHLSF